MAKRKTLPQPVLDMQPQTVELRTQSVPLDLIQPNGSFLAPPTTPAMIDTIRTCMLFDPVLLVETPLYSGQPDFEIVDGRNRVQACRYLRDEIMGNTKLTRNEQLTWLMDHRVDPIPAIIGPIGWDNREAVAALKNLQRRENFLTVLEAINRWRQHPDVTPEQFAKHVLHIPLGRLRRYLRLTELTAPLLQALLDGKISQNQGLALGKFPYHLQDRAAQRLQVEGKLKNTDLAELRQVHWDHTVYAMPPALFGADEARPIEAPAAPPAPAAPGTAGMGCQCWPPGSGEEFCTGECHREARQTVLEQTMLEQLVAFIWEGRRDIQYRWDKADLQASIEAWRDQDTSYPSVHSETEAAHA